MSVSGKDVGNPLEKREAKEFNPDKTVAKTEEPSATSDIKTSKGHQPLTSSSSDRQLKFERAQKCLENAALVSKRIKEHRKATAELLGKPFEEDEIPDTASEMASTISERTGYSALTDTSTTISVQEALNIPGISESLANTLKQKELLMERIKQYKEISKRPMGKIGAASSRRESSIGTKIDTKRLETDATQLQQTVKEKENALSIMQVKMKAMETTILELQEKINEKDMIIEAKTKATSLMSDNLSKKEKESLSLLEDTRQHMSKMQENFVLVELEWKEEKERLLNELDKKNEKIKHLEEANTLLENSRFEISLTNSNLIEELNEKNNQILELQRKLDELSKSSEQLKVFDTDICKDTEMEKGSLEIEKMAEMSHKIELLEKLNCQIRQTNKELEYRLNNLNQESKQTPTSSSKKSSPGANRKGSRNTSSKMKSPWSTQSETTQEQDKKQSKNEDINFDTVMQSLNKDLLEKELEISQKDILIQQLQRQIDQKTNLVKELEETISNIKEGLDGKPASISNKKDVATDTLNEDLVVESLKDDNVASPNVTEDVTQENIISTSTDLETELQLARDQINLLNSEIDAANKNMIKVKSVHKLKLKQMQKTIDNFSKVSDVNTEMVRLNEEVHQLTQKVAELEEEKGNLQLHLVDYDSGRLTESETYKKMMEMENLAEVRLKAISALEAQKFDLVQELHILKQNNVEMEDKLADLTHLQSEQVCSEMKLVQLEEQIDDIITQKNDLENTILSLKQENVNMKNALTLIQQEKEEMAHKLEQYIQENMELTDKLEKLSAEKVSSAESIEIVESLTTQEKLELEEYNKTIANKNIEIESRLIESHVSPQDLNESVLKLTEESAELNKKIELFTQERQEVMEKMSNINKENTELQREISELNRTVSTLQNVIDILNHEKNQATSLNEELHNQIEELKKERIDLLRDYDHLNKPVMTIDNASDNLEIQQDDKTMCEKGSKTKSVKQLTKEILKLKNVIKEREDEIADCQMQILSLEEQHQKLTDLINDNQMYENKLKTVTDERDQLKQELLAVTESKEIEGRILQSEEIEKIKQSNDSLQLDINRIQNEYHSILTTRDIRIQELENLLQEYERQIKSYVSSLQHKDKELTEYINQVSKLNDVSQKLKSTIELLEEEKANDQNIELIKSLNVKISVYEKSLSDYEDKLKILEEEKLQLQSEKSILETQNMNLDIELQKLNENLTEKQTIIKDLHLQKQKYDEEISSVKLKVKERDEEIHEIKLQLRKESIENEKLHTNLIESTKAIDENVQEISDLRNRIQYLEEIGNETTVIEAKNKELMDKLKKFALNLKKKSNTCADLEKQVLSLQNELTTKSKELEELSKEVHSISSLKDKLSCLQEELLKVEKENSAIDAEKSNSILHLQLQVDTLEQQLQSSKREVISLIETRTIMNDKLSNATEENKHLKDEILSLNQKFANFEIEIKNNANLETKISALQNELSEKQEYINRLLSTTKELQQKQNGSDAKIQECTMYIEHLQSEISKYKHRICRLEESISAMENRRHSLERKADQLDSQLQEKYKAYTEYTTQEDELVNRIAMLMEHDKVVEKQLREIENENKDLQIKNQSLTEDNETLQKYILDVQDELKILREKSTQAENVSIELNSCQSKLVELESHLKKITNEHQITILKNKEQIDELETEFNTQIENAIKEKKIMNEKCERMNEQILQLEQKLQEYAVNIHTLTLNLDDTNCNNQNLKDQLDSKEKKQFNDYTEQYISEINKLHSEINEKNSMILKLDNDNQMLKNNIIGIKQELENQISELKKQISIDLNNITRLDNELTLAKHENENLQSIIKQKDEDVKTLKEQKFMSFEMTIPKTEGMVISSTMEELRDEPIQKSLTDLESQIVSDVTEKCSYIDSEHMVKAFEYTSDKTTQSGDNPENEPLIVPKKTYLCYKDADIENIPQTDVEELDVFHSEEGWGFQESIVDTDVIPGLSHLKEQIEKLNRENDILKSEITTSNNKLIKALKKIKEMKASYDILSNELRLSKQLSQSTLLDTAIEDELNDQIKELSETVNKLQTELVKEKREKESIRKQNEIFANANDRLTEMKEKLDSEVELWKYKFKEVNDKMSTLQWGSEQNETSVKKSTIVEEHSITCNNEDYEKLEKENEELHFVLEQMRCQNNELASSQSELKNTIRDLKEKTQQIPICGNCEKLSIKIVELEELNKKSQHLKICEDCNKLSLKIAELQELNSNDVNEKNMLLNKLSDIEGDYDILKQKYDAAIVEYEKLNKSSEFNGKEREGINQRYQLLESQLNNAKDKIMTLELALEDTLAKLSTYEEESKLMTTKMQNLNFENDQLLSTVAELRSSISSAVDQRGYEIAEMWKQHLAQRETDFTKVEQELRTQLSAFESKYEQLLDNMQSSSQEETNKLVMIGQLNTLQNKLKDKEEHISNLQNKYSDIMSEMEILRSEMEDEKIIHENKVLSQQDEYEKHILELTTKFEQEKSEYEETISNLKAQLITSTANYNQLLNEMDNIKLQLKEMESKVLHLNNEIRIKDSEIYQKTHEYTLALTQRNEEFDNVRKQLLDYENKIEELTYEKESELAVLRLKMHDKSSYFENTKERLEKEKLELSELLNNKILECGKLNKEIIDLNKTLEENTNKISEMQIALENQEIEIVSLNDEVSKLQTLLRTTTNKIDKHVTFASDTKPGSDEEPSEKALSKDLLDFVPRAELDLALYMLHQRDVRCEELTMELTQLLDERDTLQLRLSDSLRSCEELKTKCRSTGLDVSFTSSTSVDVLPDSLNVSGEQLFVDIHKPQTSRSSSISDIDSEKPKLQAKLSELRTVRHSRDVRLRQDSEQRQLDMRLLQRDVANLPPEAADQLRQAHHTLSRDSESTSTVLLNWLRGKSTPKVVHM